MKIPENRLFDELRWKRVFPAPYTSVFHRPWLKVIVHAIIIGVVVGLVSWLLSAALCGCQSGPQTPVEKDPWDKPLKEQTDAELQESLRHWDLEIRKDVAHFDAVGRRPVRSEGQAKLQDLGMDAAAAIQEAHESWKAGVEAEIALRKTKKSPEVKR